MVTAPSLEKRTDAVTTVSFSYFSATRLQFSGEASPVSPLHPDSFSCHFASRLKKSLTATAIGTITHSARLKAESP